MGTSGTRYSTRERVTERSSTTAQEHGFVVRRLRTTTVREHTLLTTTRIFGEAVVLSGD